MKFTTLLTLLVSFSVAFSAKIPSRKVAAPTNTDYVVPAPSPTTTTNNNSNVNQKPTAAKVPSRNVMPPTSSARTTTSSARSSNAILDEVTAVTEPVQPKILTSPAPVAPLPRTTIEEEDLLVLSSPQKQKVKAVVADVATSVEATTDHQPSLQSNDNIVTEESQSKVFPIHDFTEAVSEPASAPDVILVPQLPPLITAQEPTMADTPAAVHEEPTCNNRSNENNGCNNEATTGEGDIVGEVIEEEEILIVSVEPRRR